jgi:OmpR family response regulator RpaB
MDRKPKILVVDDDPSALMLMDTMLTPCGYDVVTIISTNKRLAKTAREEQPDLILMDIMMPVEDGYTALNELKSEIDISKIPVVMVSALDSEENKALAKQCGAAAYITKPVDRGTLYGTIERLLPKQE